MIKSEKIPKFHGCGYIFPTQIPHNTLVICPHVKPSPLIFIKFYRQNHVELCKTMRHFTVWKRVIWPREIIGPQGGHNNPTLDLLLLQNGRFFTRNKTTDSVRDLTLSIPFNSSIKLEDPTAPSHRFSKWTFVRNFEKQGIFISLLEPFETWLRFSKVTGSSRPIIGLL